MLIRSQDKMELINLDNASQIGIEGENIVAYLPENGYAEIGEYSSESKAIKVLDVIQTAYDNVKYFRVMREKSDYASSIFEMPQDSEVKE